MTHLADAPRAGGTPLIQVWGNPSLIRSATAQIDGVAEVVDRCGSALVRVTLSSSGLSIAATERAAYEIRGVLSAVEDRYRGAARALHAYAAVLEDVQRLIDEARTDAALASSLRRQAQQVGARSFTTAEVMVGSVGLAASEEQALMARADLLEQRAFSTYSTALGRYDLAVQQATELLAEDFSASDDRGLMALVKPVLPLVASLLPMNVWAAEKLRGFYDEFREYNWSRHDWLVVHGFLGAALVLGFLTAGAVAFVLFALVMEAVQADQGHERIYPNRMPSDPYVSTGVLRQWAHESTQPMYALVQESMEVYRLSSEGDQRDTNIRVVAVSDVETGEVASWRVVLPGTQDFDFMSPQLNNWGTNTLYTFWPWRTTLMDVAIKDALDRAGALESDAPILFVGHSQGGISAMRAVDRIDWQGRDISAITFASPIDNFRADIGSSARVVEFEAFDVVTGAESLDLSPLDMLVNSRKWESIPLQIGHSLDGFAAEFKDWQRRWDPALMAHFGDTTQGTVEVIYDFGYQRPEREPLFDPLARQHED